jgi:hypothetical protein
MVFGEIFRYEQEITDLSDRSANFGISCPRVTPLEDTHRDLKIHATDQQMESSFDSQLLLSTWACHTNDHPVCLLGLPNLLTDQ